MERIDFFRQFITPQRWERLTKVLQERTRYITVVLEDIYQPHNSSAVLRSCDGFGIQDVHILENRNSFRLSNGVALGSGRWLNLHRWKEKGRDNSTEALEALKAKGYRIVATTPHARGVDLEDFDLTKGRAAFVFGNELDGVSSTVLDQADEYLQIPIHGFVESFNISVSCAVLLHHLSWKLRQDPQIVWSMDQEEQKEVLLQWLRKSVKHSKALEQQFMSAHSH